MGHHFVPKFYFKPWLCNGKLVRFAVPRDRLFIDHPAPKAVCQLPKLNSLSNAIPQEKREAIEAWLTDQVDTKAAPLFLKIAELGRLDPSTHNAEAWGVMVRFILGLIARLPESVSLLEKSAPEVLRQQLAKEDKELIQKGMLSTYRSLEEFANLYHPGLIENTGKFLMPSIIDDKKWGEVLLRKQWCIVKFKPNAALPLLTCDRPLIRIGVTLDDKDTLLTLPISPDVALFISSRRKLDELIAVGHGRLAMAVNQSIITNARQYVFGTSETKFGDPSSSRHMIERGLLAKKQIGAA